jgi:hypothetical protein
MCEWQSVPLLTRRLQTREQPPLDHGLESELGHGLAGHALRGEADARYSTYQVAGKRAQIVNAAGMTNSSLDQPGTIAGRVDARSLWTGGLAAAIVAALLAITGIVVARGVFMATATVLAAAEPFTTNARLSARVATATINIVLGLAIWSLVSGSARRSQPARVDNGRLPPIDY